MKKTLILLATASLLCSLSHAGTVAHWQFNDLTDSSGNGYNLTNTNSSTSLSGGQAIFTGGGSSTAGSDLMSAADNPAWDDTSFTVEAIFTFTAPSTAGISTLAAHLSNGGGRQWLLGTSDTNTPYVILRNNASTPVESSIGSTFAALVSGNTYYFAAAIDLTAATPADRITFYLRDITNDGPFQSANVSTSFTGLAASSAPLTIGSTGHSTSRFRGSINEIRISDTKLGPGELLIVPEPSHAMLSTAGMVLLALRRKRR